MVELVGAAEFTDWFLDLSKADATAVARVIGYLEERGVALGIPYSSAISGNHRYAFRELRIQSRGHPLRGLYVFDRRRQAVLLVGGDKTGNDRFYQQLIPQAERVWEEYLAETS